MVGPLPTPQLPVAGAAATPKLPTLSPATSPPAPAITPPAAPPQIGNLLQQGMNWVNRQVPGMPSNAVSNFGQGLTDMFTTAATQNTPPLSYLTHNLGSLKGPADAALSLAQRGSQDPAQFAQLGGVLAKPVMEGVLGAPFGLPLLAGLQGVLAGGQAFTDAKTVFSPLLRKAGLV